MFELSKQFRFDAAHTLECDAHIERNRHIHGHSYRAEVTVRGMPDEKSGMLIDLGVFESALEDTRHQLDHRFLNEINDLGPGTLENLSAWIWRRLEPTLFNMSKITVFRDSGSERCVYYGPRQKE